MNLHDVNRRGLAAATLLLMGAASPAFGGSSGPLAAERHPTVDLNGVEATMRAHKQDFQSCYHQEVLDGDPPSGTVKMAFIVDPHGHVSRIGIRESNLGSARLESCVVGATRKISF